MSVRKRSRPTSTSSRNPSLSILSRRLIPPKVCQRNRHTSMNIILVWYTQKFHSTNKISTVSKKIMPFWSWIFCTGSCFIKVQWTDFKLLTVYIIFWTTLPSSFCSIHCMLNQSAYTDCLFYIFSIFYCTYNLLEIAQYLSQMCLGEF